MGNLADLLGIVFLGWGILDGYLKGFVKKGISLAASLGTLLIVYAASPYVAQVIEEILPEAFSIQKLAGTDSQVYQLLILSGLGAQAEQYLYGFISRILSVILTYAVVRILFFTLGFSLGIMARAPGLGMANRLLGAGFGLIQQLLILWMIFLVITIFSHTGWGETLYQMIRESMCMGYLYDHNLLLLLGILLMLDL